MRLTRHVDGVGKEVCEVCDQHDKTCLCFRITSHICKLERQRSHDAYHDTNKETPEEDAKENAKRLKQAHDAKVLSTIFVFLRRLEENNGDCIVEDGLAKDERVELWLDFVGIEDGENSDRVGGRERCAN
jgi:CRISPR/Cas system-associated protein Cas10 (large subunit of type III CRISPR-Cas system)